MTCFFCASPSRLRHVYRIQNLPENRQWLSPLQEPALDIERRSAGCTSLSGALGIDLDVVPGVRRLQAGQQGFLGQSRRVGQRHEKWARLLQRRPGLLVLEQEVVNLPETVLLTGTGIVPQDDFTLAPGDVVRINISGIGSIENTVVEV